MSFFRDLVILKALFKYLIILALRAYLKTI